MFTEFCCSVDFKFFPVTRYSTGTFKTSAIFTAVSTEGLLFNLIPLAIFEASNPAFCPKCGTKVGGTEAVVASTSVTKINSTESYFDGGVLQRFCWSLLGGLVTGPTFGILYPLAICWLYEWEAKHTVIDGHRLKFTGSAGGLFGTWILCWFLTLITFGIYDFWVPLKI